MQRALVLIVAVVLLGSSIIANGQQASSGTLQAGDRITLDQARDCGTYLNARLTATQILARDRGAISAAESSNQQISAGNNPPIDLQQDMKILDQSETDLNRCTLGNNGLTTVQDSPKACSTEQLLNFQMNHEGDQERVVPIMRMPGSTAFFYESGMTIDADGAPNAYHPDNTGLDDLANAGSPGHWQGLAKNESGEPFVQGPDDPFPGYYVSATALTDRSKPMNNPSHYVDATKIPYIVLPGGMAREIGVHPGDFAVVVNLRNGLSSNAIFGDVGPVDRIGEGSIALAENLGVRSNARNGGAHRNIAYLVFPGSGDGRPKTLDEINSEAAKLLQDWGGIAQLTSCVAAEPVAQVSGSRGVN